MMKTVFIAIISIAFCFNRICLGAERNISFRADINIYKAVLSDSTIVFIDSKANAVYRSDFIGNLRMITKESNTIYDLNVFNDTLNVICKYEVVKDIIKIVMKKYLIKNDSLVKLFQHTIPSKSVSIRYVNSSSFSYICGGKILICDINNGNIIGDVPFTNCALESKLAIDTNGCYFAIISNAGNCQLTLDNSYYLYGNCNMNNVAIRKTNLLNRFPEEDNRSFLIDGRNIFISYSKTNTTVIYKLSIDFPDKIEIVQECKQMGRLISAEANKILLVYKNTFTIVEVK
jgi:hypothetical protein